VTSNAQNNIKSRSPSHRQWNAFCSSQHQDQMGPWQTKLCGLPKSLQQTFSNSASGGAMQTFIALSPCSGLETVVRMWRA
jgi:hypothetical protein